ncbi:hypothetical protein [Dyadobacter crusticola]|uniref:hypothetical protein n=1 Tax=Dyadobacter crusticola TaxID=292407 RepID=UPI0012FAE7A4|nr:hypothetical protein [Dyadobacter crusticola]
MNAGLVKLGTGDMFGLMFGFSYEKKFSPRLSWLADLSTTIHDGADLMLVTIENQPTQDISYRYTIAGAQVGGKLAYDFIKSSKIDFGMRLGALLHYQSSSLADQRAIYFPIVTGYPLPLTVTIHREPQRTFALGGQAQLFGNYNVNRKLAIGASLGLQLDTNGDTMFPQLQVSVGRRF